MRRITFIAAACAAIAVGAAAPAAADNEVDHPDDHGHNYYPGNATTCEQVDAPGMMLYSSEDDQAVEGQEDVIQGTVYGDDDQFLDVELLDDSYTITAVVVKGAPNYTVYLEPPWTELHAPPIGWEPEADLEALLAGGLKYPAISHWFVCGTQEEPTETPTSTPSESPSETPSEPPTETPSESPTETPSESPTETPSESPSESPSGTPSESPTVTPSPSPTDEGELPDTGGSPAAPLALAGGLLVAGLLALRHRFVKA